MTNVFRDVRYAARRLLKKPAFTLIAVLSVAIGIGANTAIFSLVNAVIIRDLPLSPAGRAGGHLPGHGRVRVRHLLLP